MADDFDPLNAEPIARKSLVLFYLIDTSGSMEGTKIGTVNTVMEEVIPEIRNIGGADSEVKVAVMTFDSQCNWVYSKPISVEDFKWKDLTTGGLTSLGDAFKELNKKLSRKEFLQSPSLSFAPVIFVLSDGEPTDDYKDGLNELSKNNWFKYSLKIAVGIGQDANKEILSEFTGNNETVLMVNNGKALAKVIKFITVTSSEIGSKSIGFDDNGNGQGITPEEASKVKNDALIDKIVESKIATDPSNIDFDDGW